MDKLAKYRECIKNLLMSFSDRSASYEDIETQIICDSERDHYLVFYVGWHNRKRMYGCVLHFDLKNSKVWLQHNGTEIDVADELMKMGVLKEDIVLAFHEPNIRKFTDFSIG